MSSNKCAMAFLHVPKTAGGTMQAVLRGSYSEGESYWITCKPSYTNHIEKIRGGRLDYDQINLIFGHFSFDLVGWLPEKFLVASMVREPVSRVWSYYRWARRNNKHFLHDVVTSNGYSVTDCIEKKLSVELDNGQTRLFAGSDIHEDRIGDEECNIKFGCCDRAQLGLAIENIRKRSMFIGVQEYFYTSLLLFEKIYGWDVGCVVDRNVDRRGEELSANERDVIERSNTMDILLYDFVLGRFKQAVADMNGLSGSVSDEDMLEIENESKKSIISGRRRAIGLLRVGDGVRRVVRRLSALAR